MFEKLLQVLRFGCSYEAIVDCSCSATTIRARCDEWIRAGIFARLTQIALDAYDRMTGLVLQEIAIDGCITKAPGGGECAGRSPVDRGKQGMKRSSMVDGYGIPLDRVLAAASRHDSPLLALRWTNSMTWARCPITSGSTSTPGTTRRKPAMSWPPAGLPADRP